MKCMVYCLAVAAVVPLFAHAQQQQPPGATTSATPATPTGARPASAPVAAAGSNYAQYLVDGIVALHPELTEVDLHATAPGSGQSAIIAAKTRSRVGKPSDPDDLAVMKTGEPRLEINLRGNQNV